MTSIRFYRVEAPYGEFSNFAAFPIVLKGRKWPTTEHSFQAQTFPDTEHEENIRLLESPMIAARAGRDRKKPLPKDWETVKDEVMTEAGRAKFTQHPRLRDLLISTGDAHLIEHTRNDRYWGDGGDGTGLNKLGQILIAIRDELRKEKSPR
jgi:N-glycosidase YbiA